MKPDLLAYILQRIEDFNPLHAKKLSRNIESQEKVYFERAELFLDKYVHLLEGLHRDLNYGIDCYLRVCADMLYEQIRFSETGRYSSRSFVEADQKVYHNPEVMEYYMLGILLSQFLWKHHYAMLDFFCDALPCYSATIRRYLEIGGGHGLYLSEANSLLSPRVDLCCVDISPISIELAKRFINDARITFIAEDILNYQVKLSYDFISMGEVLEHVEQPERLLSKMKDLLASEGCAYITVAGNAPAIDHIYLFRDVDEIRTMITTTGFEIINDIRVFSEDLPEKSAESEQVPFMYAALLSKV
jgi:SAM-dependent methyltransferase